MKKKIALSIAGVSIFLFSALLIWGLTRDGKEERKARNLVAAYLMQENLDAQIQVKNIVSRGLTGLSVELRPSLLANASDLEMKEWSHRIGNYLKMQMATPANVIFASAAAPSALEVNPRFFKNMLFVFGCIALLAVAAVYFFRERKTNLFKLVRGELFSREHEVRELVVSNERLTQENGRLRIRLLDYERELNKMKTDLSSALHLWENSHLTNQEVEFRYREALVKKETLEEKVRMMRKESIRAEREDLLQPSLPNFI